MNVLHSLILGIVEGITEFLPISSTGHLILTGKLLNLPETEFLKTFEIAIQLGAIASVVVLYWKNFWDMDTLKKLITAFIPTGIIGLVFYKIVKNYLLGNESVVLWSLLIGGVVLIIFELFHRKTMATNSRSTSLETITYKKSFLIGIFQSISIIPGVSRSAATIIGGLSLGLDRKTITEFSFLLAVPTMMAATGLDLAKNANLFSADKAIVLIVGFATSFIVAMFSIKLLLNFVKKHNFISFGIYRVVLAAFFWLFILNS